MVELGCMLMVNADSFYFVDFLYSTRIAQA